jgi:prepilin-type N-terminal cleavage/methylation domain-containing protein
MRSFDSTRAPQGAPSPTVGSEAGRDRIARCHAGFTLLEFLVTLAVLGIVLAISIPGLLAVRQRRLLEGSGEQMMTFMQRARFLAIQRNRPQRVVPDLTARVLFLDADADGVLDDSERFDGVAELQTGVRFGGPPGDDAAVVDFTLAGGSRIAIFRPDGAVVDGGAFRLSDPEGNDFLEVRVVEPASGLTRLRKWDGAAWKEKGQGGEAWHWN